jgi:hypothetical protein
VLVMALQGPEVVRSDGDALYRTDGAGTRTVVVPATCRRGVHRLGAVGYRLTGANGLLRVRCDACATVGEPEHSWILRSSGPLANIAELDDAPYNTSNQ